MSRAHKSREYLVRELVDSIPSRGGVFRIWNDLPEHVRGFAVGEEPHRTGLYMPGGLYEDRLAQAATIDHWCQAHWPSILKFGQVQLQSLGVEGNLYLDIVQVYGSWEHAERAAFMYDHPYVYDIATKHTRVVQSVFDARWARFRQGGK